MPQIYSNGRIKKIHAVGHGLIKKGYACYGKGNTALIYSASSLVTYYVDKGVQPYTEEVEYGASCLSPKTFTPTKSGYTFVGWREDTEAPVADDYVLKEKIMGDAPVTLYAVFKKTITAKFISYNNTNPVTGTLYYNNENTVSPSIKTPTLASYSGWTSRGWSAAGNEAANASIFRNAGDTIDNLTSDATYYGLYYKVITLSYNGNGNTGGSTASSTGTVNYSGSGKIIGVTFELASNGFTKSGYNFTKWALDSNDGNEYSVGDSITITNSTTMYALWTMKSWTTIVTFEDSFKIGSNTGSDKRENYTLQQSFSNYVKLKFNVGTWKSDGDDDGIMVIIKDSSGKTYGTFKVNKYSQDIVVDTNGAKTIIVSHAGRYPDGDGAYTQALRLRTVYGIPK